MARALIIGNLFNPDTVRSKPPGSLPPGAFIKGTVTSGGPDGSTDGGLPRDRRLYLDAESLEFMLNAARESASGRCVLYHAGVTVDLVEVPGAQADGSSHFYEIWRMIGSEVKPEIPKILLPGRDL